MGMHGRSIAVEANSSECRRGGRCAGGDMVAVKAGGLGLVSEQLRASQTKEVGVYVGSLQ